MKKAAVLLSGSGTTLENIFTHMSDGKLPIDITCVISSRQDAFGLTRAERRSIPTHVFPRAEFKNTNEYTEAIFAPIRESGAQFVIMAGFMVRLGIPDDYKGRILNVHPALLPSFGGKGMYGHHCHEAVIAHGCKVSGATVHFCDEEYDTGPIIMQSSVEVKQSDTPDTLAERVQEAEREIYPKAIKLFIDNKLKLDGRRVIIDE